MEGTETQVANGAAAEETGRVRGTVARDADDAAIARIGGILSALTEVERSRVVRYLAEKYDSYLSE